MKSRMFLLVALIAIIAVCACSQLAVAKTHKTHPTQFAKHHHRVIIKRHAAIGHPNAAPIYGGMTLGLYSLYYGAGNPSYPDNYGYDALPCWGGYDFDCMAINDDDGNPLPDITETLLVADPQYLYNLNNDSGYVYTYNDIGCDGKTNGSSVGGDPDYIPCGQIIAAYEDESNDTTDDQLFLLTIAQGTAIIYDSGTENWGVNDSNYDGLGGDVPPDASVDSESFNLGTLGQTGLNNGNCMASYQYPVYCCDATHTSDSCPVANMATCAPPGPTYKTPTTCAGNPDNCPDPALTSPNYAGGWPENITDYNDGYYDWPYVVAANKTCVEPVNGLATVTALTSLATPTWSYKANAAPKGSTVSPGGVWTVKFAAAKYKLTQKFNIFLYGFPVN